MSWSKYNARRTLIDGISFPSRLEADVYAHLKLLATQNLLSDIVLNPTAKLTQAAISYKSDFKYIDFKGREIWVEAKGIETDRWRIIKRLWEMYGTAELHVYKRSKRGVYIAEEIVPEGIKD